ncbi:hypothetical protein BH10CYA1_BH10CYA1_02850 [soil metagenome]
MRVDKFDLGQVMQVTLNALNLLFLGYLIVYASACPTAPLISAVAFEIVFYSALGVYRIWKSKQKKSNQQLQVEALHVEWKALGRLRKTYRLSVCAVALLAFIYLSIDLTALLLAKFGYLDLACAIYRAISPPPSPAIHPGFTMELLAGGYIEAKQFRNAEPIVLAAEKLRRSLVGEQDELIADIYANLGDLYAKNEQNAKAETYYTASIALAKELHLRQGHGSPMTKLATLYAKEGRFHEAEDAFREAIAIRTKIFGSHSVKVAETLVAKAELLRLEGKTRESENLKRQIETVPEPTPHISTTLVPVSISVASAVVFWKRDRLVLIAANLLRNSRPH